MLPSARNIRAGLEPASGRGRRGFSAVEMLVVLAIIGMMVLVSAPQMMVFWNSMKVRTAAHKLMSHARLCRQVAVSKRTDVILEIQRTNGTTQPVYRAWEERNARSHANHIVRNPNGADGVANTIDDERIVVANEIRMGIEGVTFVDSYNDLTPTIPNDPVGPSIMNSDGIMRLRFMSNGQVVRIADDLTEHYDTQIRMRLERPVTGSRTDRWDVTLNRVGKVGSDFMKVTN